MTITPNSDLRWHALPMAARLYVTATVAAGAILLLALAPRVFPQPALFLFLLITVCVTSAWKVNLPISLASGSTLSVSYAADLMALLLLGPRAAVAIAAVGVWTQCTINVKRRIRCTAPRSAWRRSDHDGGDRRWSTVDGRRPSAPFDIAPLHEAAGRRDRHLLLRAIPALVAIAIALSTRPIGDGGSGARISCGARPASWSPAPPARWRRWSIAAASTGRRC